MGLFMNSTVGAVDLFATQTRLFAQVMSAYKECDPEIQDVVLEMVDIVNDAEATNDEKDAAIHTIVEALFPAFTHELTRQDRSGRTAEAAHVLETLQAEEKHFADRVSALMIKQKLTQEELAVRVGVGQSAIANMLARRSRPQRKTVAKFAEALGVEPSDLM